MRHLVAFLLLSAVSLSTFGMGKRPPADLSGFSGKYRRLQCSIDTVTSSWTPHTIEFWGFPNGQAKIVLQTKASVLTTRQFTIQEGKRQKCFADDIYTAKCTTRKQGDALEMHVNWNCHALFLFCLAQTPKDYAFSIEPNGNMKYTEDGAICEYQRIQ